MMSALFGVHVDKIKPGDIVFGIGGDYDSMVIGNVHQDHMQRLLIALGPAGIVKTVQQSSTIFPTLSEREDGVVKLSLPSAHERWKRQR